VVASHNDAAFPVGSRWPLDGPSLNAQVFQTGLPARIEDHEGLAGPVAAAARASGVGSAAAVPIIVDGRVWGMIAVGVRLAREALPAHAGLFTSRLVLSSPTSEEIEKRLAAFTELVATAIANADSHDQLTASRARLLIEADEARRRVVRDLHDGAQQRLVHGVVTLKAVQEGLRSRDPALEPLVAEALDHVERGLGELRELAHGVLPSALTHGGLRAGVDAVVSRLDLPVDVEVPGQRFPAEVEASTYFIIAEALTNVAKHAGATRADVRAAVDDGMLRVEVHDDGIGGADATGHGLVGLADRAMTLGGRLKVESPRGGGTLLTATLPLT
jgi:signal transduction histidine kinase